LDSSTEMGIQNLVFAKQFSTTWDTLSDLLDLGILWIEPCIYAGPD
jgi:hypothetical protein